MPTYLALIQMSVMLLFGLVLSILSVILDNYRITDFREDQEFGGRQLWIGENAHPQHRPSDALLRDHFQQCSLANVKSAGRERNAFFDSEGDFDLKDFTRRGEKVSKGQPTRLELEVRSRLYYSALPVE